MTLTELIERVDAARSALDEESACLRFAQGEPCDTGKAGDHCSSCVAFGHLDEAVPALEQFATALGDSLQGLVDDLGEKA